MPVKIRLQRHGKKGKPFYWVVAADARATRDGKFLEKLGIYNPNTNPATIELNVDSSVKWLQNGAQPTDTARAILSYRGVLLKHHLLGGVRKGALTEEQAEEKFNTWVSEKEQAIADKVGGLDKVKADARAAALKAEKEVNEKRAAEAAAAALPETPEGESAEEEIQAVEAAGEPEQVVETADTPTSDVDNADTTPVAPVKEEGVIAANDDMAEAPSVKEVIENNDEDVKPADTGDKA
ncbi:30S ribosomal protein S16 [Maribacter sp. X9]|uniref:30S ribosomal protein S16 n=1 Tax=Maribacter sp. X9 TaxID=3402159 RepID=UPI003AF34926